MEFAKRKNNANSASREKRFKIDNDEQKQVNLWDLPMGPLQLIISKADKDDHPLMVRHVLQVLAEATEYYINAGYDLIFAGCLLRSDHFEQLEIGGQAIDVTQMHQFLHEFYTHVEATPTCSHLKQRRLIYTVTLLNILRQFQRFQIVSSVTPLLHWQLHIELCGIYFGINHVAKLHASEKNKFIDFLAIMAELLVLDMADETVNRYTEIGQSIYIYGRKQQQALNSRTPRINLKLSILGPSGVRGLLEDVINGKVPAASDVIYPSVDESALNIQLEVWTTSRNEIIGNNSMQICVVSLA
ncbi:uncharacterized protein LOC6558979 isoform X2 [Drosophila grimshawi]|uniref:uncharacterized protein LOC6558979 isoform X2 n=1 Tax=Drosophila grimshawi TaxID=7222 RepID=UPI000C871477|nr:uncharacterized protein LOC6558979 isoform X2 [Drosophila grimshawi]